MNVVVIGAFVRRNYFLLSAAGLFILAAFFFSPDAQKHRESKRSWKGADSLSPAEHSLANRVEQLEDQMKTIREEGLGGSKNPLHGFMNVSFLYWKAWGNQWKYATAIEGSGSLANQGGFVAISGESKWKPGGRFTLGFAMPYHWDISGIWTYYHNESISSCHADDGLLGLFALEGTAARSLAKIDYNVGDVEFAGMYGLIKNCCVRPYISVRGARIWQHVVNHYTGGADISKNGLFRNASKWNGFGPRAGANVAYYFGRSGLSFFGGLSATLLFGSLHAKSDIEGLSAGHAQIRDNHRDLKTNLQTLIGADIHWRFDRGKKAFSLHAAWEANYWWHMGEEAPLQTAGNSGVTFGTDLTMSGITAGGSLEY